MEGETEEWYIALLKDEEDLYRSKNIKLKIEVLKDKRPDKIESKLIDIFESGCDGIVWIVDLDQISSSRKLSEREGIMKKRKEGD